MPTPIRRSRAKETEEFSDSATMSIEHGAVVKAKSVKRFPAKFNDQDGQLWPANISARMIIVDDRTEDGEDDDKEFFDRFALKMNLDVLDRLGLEDSDLQDANINDFSSREREAILDESNWTIRDNSKADKFNLCLFGKEWSEGNLEFHEDLWVDRQFIAKIHPRSGKRPGSYCGWDSFVSIDPPKKKKKAVTPHPSQQQTDE